MRKNDRRVRRPVELERVLAVGIQTGGQHYTVLRRAREDVATHSWASIKPIGIVERAPAQPEYVRKSFQVQIHRRAAPAAEIQGDALLAGIRSVIISFWDDSGEHDVLSLEYWFNQES